MENILDTDPNAADAIKRWNHWYRLFTSYLGKAKPDADKLDILTRHVDHTVYEFIAEYTDYETAINALEKMYVKQKSSIYARHLLSTSRQEESEDIDQFVHKLRTIARDCDFTTASAKERCDEAVRDALITGLQSVEIREKLLAQHELSLENALRLGRSLELARKQARSYEPTLPCAAVSTPTPVQEPEEESKTLAAMHPLKCYFCGYSKHPRNKCPAREATCRSCGKTGHFQRVCNSKRSSPNVNASTQISSILCSSNASESLSNALTKLRVNGVEMRALIDTGSSGSFVSEEVVRFNKWEVLPGHKRILMASTSLTCSSIGFCYVDIIHNDRRYPKFKLDVLSNLCADVLLGHDFLCLHSKVEIPFGGSSGTLNICSVAAAKLSSPPLFANLSPECRPIATKSRFHSPDDLGFIRSEVARLLADGIIEPSSSPWRAQVLVTKNSNHKKRMVVDYSQTINRFTLLDAYPLPRIDQMVEKVAKYHVFSALDLESAYHQLAIRDSEKPFTAFEADGNLYQFLRVPFGVTNGVPCFQRAIDSILRQEHVRDTFVYVDNVTVCGSTQSDHDKNLNHFLSVCKKYSISINHTKSVLSAQNLNLLGYNVSNGAIKPDPERIKPLNDIPAPNDITTQRRIIGMFAYYSQWIPAFSDKIAPLVRNSTFPLPSEVEKAFTILKEELKNAVLVTIAHDRPLTVETDASDIALAASLNQDGRPVAFFSRTLTKAEKSHSSVEKEACAIVEAVKKWRHYLVGRHFKLVTDQRSVSFMYSKHHSRIKNDKVQRWRLELSEYSFDVVYRPGPQNCVADTLSRNVCGSMTNASRLDEIHRSLCHPGVTRMMHFIRSKNLPYSVEEVKRMTSLCRTCAQVKPKFAKFAGQLIKATQPFERLSMDFKGPIPSSTRNKYLLTIIDEYSRFPFAFQCPDMTSATVVRCLKQLFILFGLPSYIHTDRGTAFLASDVKEFLTTNGVATSRTTPYNPQGNGQVERLNGTLWKAISLCLHSRGLDTNQWESVLSDALHSIRSLLCTSTNTTPHERLFAFHRRSANGTSIPKWLSPGESVLVRRNIRTSKYEPLVDEALVVECNPEYAHVKFNNGKLDTVSLRHLAPVGNSSDPVSADTPDHITEEPEATHDAVETQSDIVDASKELEELQRYQQRIRPYELRNRDA